MKPLGLLSAIAATGVAIALFAVYETNQSPPIHGSAIPVERPPFPSYVVGTGLTETGRGNIRIGTAIAGLVKQVYVHVGDEVDSGAPLFGIDDRALQASLVVAKADVDKAQAALLRPEHYRQYVEHLRGADRTAVSAETLSNARDDVDAARSTLKVAQAHVAQLQIDIDRCVVKAPHAGRVLQVNVRTGEYADNGGSAKPLLILGDDRRMYVRVDIDENDAWRVRPGAPARAFVRGDARLSVPLRFEYIEPYVTPRVSLTGRSTERTDVRVLHVVYSFERGTLPVYLGQQMDVFIKAPSVADSASRARS